MDGNQTTESRATWQKHGKHKTKKTTATVRDDTNNTRTPEKRTRQNPVGREPTKCCCCKQKQTHTHSSAVLLVDWFVAHRHSKHGGIATRKRVFRHLGCCCKACTQESPKFLARLQIACRPCRASIGPGSEIVIKLVPRQKINPNHETHNRNKRNQIETQEENSKTQQQQQQQQHRQQQQHNATIDAMRSKIVHTCCPPRWVLEWNGCIGLAFVSHRVVYKPTTTNLLGLVVFPGQDRRSMSRNARDAIACNIDRKLAWLPPVRSPSPPSELPIRVLLPPNVRRRCRHCAIACRGIVCS
mmetsp:Transcript_3312/g.7468  ORF Transcript_3312/g.7468 Transcript_3312/m.7468 type:complete len:299 (-) Transcript_3312:185-1081(-)